MAETSRTRAPAASRMTLMEHLTELRKRSSSASIAVAVCTVVMFFLYNRVLHFLSGPYEQVTKGRQGVRRHQDARVQA